MKFLLTTLILIGVFYLNLYSQSQFTPYDELPGISKIYKPAYSDSYTGWKKMLYEYPVDYKEIKTSFASYIQNHPTEKSAIIRYYKIWIKAVQPWINQNGEIIVPDMSDLDQQQYTTQKSAQILQKSTSVNQADWTFLGPKETFWRNEENIRPDRLNEDGSPEQCPWQVNVYSIDVAMSNEEILYCGTETGYVNKTTDKGLSWTQMGKNYLFGGSVLAVAIHPSNADIVYVSAGKQIHKSMDGGISWTPLLAPGKKFAAHRLKINPNNADIIIAAAFEGLYISKDAGDSWTRKWSQRNYDVEFNAGDPNTIYGITKNTSGKYEIVISSDNGENFAKDPNFPSTYTETSGGLLAVTKANANVLYATLLAKEGDENVPFILKGTFNDGKFTWTETRKGEYGSVGGLGGFTNGQGYFDLVLEISPNNENLVFWGTCSLWKSSDGGINFSGVGGYRGEFPIHPDIQDMKILESGDMWVATDGGVNFSSDLFTSQDNYFSRTNGIIGSAMWGFDQGWNEDIIVGGRYHNGNTAIADFYGDKALRMGGAESATGWVIKGKSRHVAFNDLGNGWILPKTATEVAEGRFIFSKFPNMDEYGGRRSNLVHHPNYYGTIYVGEGNAMWRSYDSGESFDLLFQFPDKIRYFQISHKNPDVMYADIINKGLYRSEDGGKSWEHKPALTNGSAGDSYWNGKLFFVISPYDENKIYVCLQNGAWSSDIGKIFRSADGGNSWADWTNGLEGYTKCLLIQPTNNGQDLVYLFTQGISGLESKVYIRYESQPYWNDYNTNYLAGNNVNLALPFYRDSKIRVAGSSGVWESPMAETEFTPVVNPWVAKQTYDCMADTLYFDDHSILNHNSATWEWEITPEPEFISNKNTRNPKVVLGSPGSYDVTLKVTQNGTSYEKTINEMVSTTTCPSVDDCNNPAEVDKSIWTVLYADSQETAGEDGKAENAFDGDAGTIWHTEWYYQKPGQPHEIQIDMGKEYLVSKVKYLPRQSSSNGRIKDYEIYVSKDKTQWGEPVHSGEFSGGASMKTVVFSPKAGKYLRIKSLSEQNGNHFTSIAELDVSGCIEKDITDVNQVHSPDINAYPIPASDKLTVSLPGAGDNTQWQYAFYSMSSGMVKSGAIYRISGNHTFNIDDINTGTYILKLTNERGQIFRIKLVKR